MDEDQTQLRFARDAASSAMAFADRLAAHYTDIALWLRGGNDSEALHALGESTEDLEHFFTFLVLVSELIAAGDAETGQALVDYRDRLVDVVESMQPALSHIDLVEVADTLEDDLVPSLRDYRDLDDTVRSVLAAA